MIYPNTGVVICTYSHEVIGYQRPPIVISGSTKNIDIGFSIEDTYYAKTSTNSKYRSDGTFDGGGAPPGNPICSFGGIIEACLLNAAPERFIFKATKLKLLGNHLTVKILEGPIFIVFSILCIVG